LAILAVVLAGIGVYSVLAHVVARRTREFGVRIAFGAVRSQLVVHAIKRMLLPAAAGLAVGLTIAYSFRQVLVEYLFRTDAGDVSIYVLALAVVTAAHIIAATQPANRAASLDPVVALRDE
jgi:ABC-type antimicrobial peptide transport system permease subunit